MSKSLPRCSMRCKDGTQCGRRVSDDSNPPTCHVHAALAAGQPVSPLTEPAEIDEIRILKRLANDKNPQVRLRAVDQLLSWQSKQLTCPACAARRERDTRHVAILAAASDEDKSRALVLMREARVILGVRES